MALGYWQNNILMPFLLSFLLTKNSKEIYLKCQGYRLKTTMQKTMDSKAKDFSFRSASVER